MLTKVHIIKVVVFPVVMYRCEKWTIKKAEHQRIDSFDLQCWRTLERPLDSMELKPVNPKGNQSWIFIGRTDAEAEAPIFWPPDVKNWLIGKDTDAGKDWRQVKGMTEDEMVGWHHPLNMCLSKLWELVMDMEVWHASVQGVTRSWTWLSDWTELNWWGWKRRVEKLAWNSTLKKLRSWHLVPSLHGK